jgi:Fur family transcriptional regulator, ferric uptake regulator
MTVKRQRILDTLKKERLPLSALQVHARMKKDLDLTTVYRGLQYLEKNNHLESFIFDCDNRGTERYYILREIQHRHYLHCNKCHTFIPLKTCPLSRSLKNIQKEYNFKINSHVLTLVGLCGNCS